MLCCTLSGVGLIHNSFIAEWQRRFTAWPFAENTAMLVLPLLWLFLTRRDVADYGLSRAGFKDQVDAAVICGIPFGALVFLNMVNWGEFAGVAQMAAGIAVLFMFGFLLRNQPTPRMTGAAPCLILAFGHHGIGHAATGVIYYMVLLGPGEEVLFRGVIQSRLNLAFGRPYRFFGARWGWGAIIASLLFALAHVANPYALFAGQWHPVWWAGPTAFCFALPFAFLRERTGGVLARALSYPLA